MKKIPTLFARDETTHLVVNTLREGCEWVAIGEGVPTQKFDGMCCMVRDGNLFKRHEVKADKHPPLGFEPADQPDAITRKLVGWLPCFKDAPEDQYFFEAFDNYGVCPMNGTYELCGPKVNKNPERFSNHVLLRHGSIGLLGVPRDFNGLLKYLASHFIEGIVFHHPAGFMAKIKGRDFGLVRTAKPRTAPAAQEE
jgi:hypothetical protein